MQFTRANRRQWAVLANLTRCEIRAQAREEIAKKSGQHFLNSHLFDFTFVRIPIFSIFFSPFLFYFIYFFLFSRRNGVLYHARALLSKSRVVIAKATAVSV